MVSSVVLGLRFRENALHDAPIAAFDAARQALAACLMGTRD